MRMSVARGMACIIVGNHRRIVVRSSLIVVLILAASVRAEPLAYRVLVHDKCHIAIVKSNGEVEWEAPCGHSHDIAPLPNGNLLLHTGPATVSEMTREKKIVWEYTAKPKAGYSGRVEVHAFQRLDDGLT